MPEWDEIKSMVAVAKKAEKHEQRRLETLQPPGSVQRPNDSIRRLMLQHARLYRHSLEGARARDLRRFDEQKRKLIKALGSQKYSQAFGAS